MHSSEILRVSTRTHEDAEDRQFAAADQMFEQLDGAFTFPSAIQSSGPITRAPDHGVSQLLAPCTHPEHAESDGRLFFPTMLIPLPIVLKQVEKIKNYKISTKTEIFRG